MSSSEQVLLEDEDPGVAADLPLADSLAADIPLDDPAAIPPDEGDIGEAPEPDVFLELGAQPEAMSLALTPAQRAQERSFAVRAAVVALRNRNLVHYTQGARRWDGINRGRLGVRGQFPSYADCSSFATWCLWNGMRLHHRPDTVNGCGWHAGYTGTLIRHGTRVTSEKAILPGDLALYGHGGRPTHVVICIGGGLVISHGSERGPYKLPLHYTKGLMQIRRYI
jgi:NlpC/P60 family